MLSTATRVCASLAIVVGTVKLQSMDAHTTLVRMQLTAL